MLALLSTAGATAGGANASPPLQRQIAETTLTSFKIALTATRVGMGLRATVTAAGYQNSAGRWKLIGQKRIVTPISIATNTPSPAIRVGNMPDAIAIT